VANNKIINKFISKLSTLKGKRLSHFSLSKDLNKAEKPKNIDSMLELSETLAKFKQMNEIIDFANNHLKSDKQTDLHHEERVLEEVTH
jgi:hypothetical protein